MSTEITAWPSARAALTSVLIVGELGIAIWMAVALAGLAVGLKAELLLPQQFAHDRMAHAMPQGGEFGREALGATSSLTRSKRNGDDRTRPRGRAPSARRPRPFRDRREVSASRSRPALCGRRPNGGSDRPGSNRAGAASSFRPRPHGCIAAMPVIRDKKLPAHAAVFVQPRAGVARFSPTCETAAARVRRDAATEPQNVRDAQSNIEHRRAP